MSTWLERDFESRPAYLVKRSFAAVTIPATELPGESFMADRGGRSFADFFASSISLPRSSKRDLLSDSSIIGKISSSSPSSRVISPRSACFELAVAARYYSSKLSTCRWSCFNKLAASIQMPSDDLKTSLRSSSHRSLDLGEEIVATGG